MPKLALSTLLASLMVALAAVPAGCALREGRGLDLPVGAIPFVVVGTGPVTATPQTVSLGYWNPDAGTVAMDPATFFTFRAASAGQWFGDPQLFWDGGPRVVVGSSGDPIELTQSDPRLRFEAPAFLRGPVFPWRMLFFPSDREEWVGVRSSPYGKWVLELYSSLEARSPNSSFSLQLPPAFGAYTPCRVADVRYVRGQLQLVVEAGTTAQRIGLWLATLAQGVLEWDCLCADLGIQEAGPGATMARVKDTVYFAEPVGPIRYLEIQSKKTGICSLATLALDAFKAQLDSEPLWASPPDLTAYGDTLLVQYVPGLPPGPIEGGSLSGSPQLAAYLLAVRDGEVVGEVIYQHGKLTVLSGGKAVLEVPAGAGLAPPWRFPTKVGS